MQLGWHWLTLLATAFVLVACAPPAGQPGSGGPELAQPTTRKRLVMSIFADPAGMHLELTGRGGTGSVPGLSEVQQLMHASMSHPDDQDVLQPRLAEAIPSADNGLWRVLPDGRMETTWRLKPNVAWHDGTALTTEDFALAIRINRDRDIGIVPSTSLDLIEAVELPDPRTITVRWSEPFIEADAMFNSGLSPFPSHILARPFADDKPGILTHPFWRDEYIGVGPYRLQEWVPGSFMVLNANDAYLLGRPKIDQLEIRFVSAFDSVVANLLAGTVEKHLGRGFGVEQLLNLRDQAPNLNIQVGGGLMGDAIPMFPQFMNTDPPIVTNLEFRRALLMSIDRQEMNDTINYGLGQTAHTWLQPDRIEYPAIQSRLVQYPHDPRRAAQIIEGLGHSKGPDGIYRDASGHRLHIELRTTDQRLVQPRSAFSVADYWKRLGIDMEVNNVPNPLIPDREYRSQFPAFELVAGGVNQQSGSVLRWQSRMSPLPQNRFAGGNRARYQNPELDAIISRYVRTVPFGERMAALADLIHHQSENLTMMTLFYEGTVTLLGTKQLTGVTSGRVWNAHLWDQMVG